MSALIINDDDDDDATSLKYFKQTKILNNSHWREAMILHVIVC